LSILLIPIQSQAQLDKSLPGLESKEDKLKQDFDKIRDRLNDAIKGNSQEDDSSSSMVPSESATAALSINNDTNLNGTGWRTHEDVEHGYKIQYPQGWKQSESRLPMLTQKSFAITADEDPAKDLKDTLVNVYVTEASRTLDPATLKVQSIPLEQYANQQIAEVSSSKGQPNILKNEPTTIDGQPAWRLDYINNYLGTQLSYESHIFVTNGEKVYDVSLWLNPLKVEEMRPVGEKIMQTFQFTNQTANE